MESNYTLNEKGVAALSATGVAARQVRSQVGSTNPFRATAASGTRTTLGKCRHVMWPPCQYRALAAFNLTCNSPLRAQATFNEDAGGFLVALAGALTGPRCVRETQSATSREHVRQRVREVVAEAQALGDAALQQQLSDLIVFTFEVADIIEGRGERVSTARKFAVHGVPPGGAASSRVDKHRAAG